MLAIAARKELRSKLAEAPGDMTGRFFQPFGQSDSGNIWCHGDAGRRLVWHHNVRGE